jgi:hypothetical protein
LRGFRGRGLGFAARRIAVVSKPRKQTRRVCTAYGHA